MNPPADEGTDADLVARAAAGDRDAFAALYSRYQAPVYRFAVHMTGSPAAAEDIVQEAFVALMGSLGRYDSGRPLAAYLYGIARNVMRRRRHRDRRLVPLDEAEASPIAVPFGESLERRQHLCLLRRAIVALPPVYREVIVMCDLHKMPYELAAASIGRPVGTVRSRLHRARAMLAERLQTLNAPAAPLARSIERCVV
jgi:RNA polymerase sigma-70 factor (ECF subfamily)